MLMKVFLLLALCGTLSAAALPDGWQPYHSARDAVRGTVALQGKNIRITDPNNKVENGITKLFDIAPGSYFRIRTQVQLAGEKPFEPMEISAYPSPWRKERVGSLRISNPGAKELIFGPIPDGIKKVKVTIYSLRPSANDVLITPPQVEISSKPIISEATPFAAVEQKLVYLSPDGNDNHDGSRATPWKSIAKANLSVQPGMTVVFLPGKYEGTIAPGRSGAPDAPIVYKAEKPGTVTLVGSSKNAIAARIENRRHIELDGFQFRVSPGMKWLTVVNSSFCRFNNLDMEYSTVANPVGTRNCTDLYFNNIRAVRCASRRPSGTLAGDMWNNDNLHRAVFSNMRIGKVGHRPFGLNYDCSNIVIRDTIFDCRWGRNFEFFSAEKVLMERCIITNAFEGSGSMDGSAKLYINDAIFRYNLILRNGYGPLGMGGYRYRDWPRFFTTGLRFYNNTFFDNQDCAMGMGGDSFDKDYTCFRNNLFMNNIYAYNDLENGRSLRFTHRSSAENCMVAGNLFAANTPDTKTIHAVTYPERADYTAEEANAALPEYYKDNFTADPAFADPDNGNFTLKPNSPAIDKALPLTKVAKVAEGYFIFGNPKPSVFLPVEDVRFFYDGFGIEGEKGDVIMVGPDKKLARIVRIYHRQKILHLDRPIPVKAGEAVQMAYEGKAPDLGAYEFNAAKSTGPVFDDKSIRHNPDPKTLLKADMEDADTEEWFYLWNFSRQPNSYAQRAKGGYNSGYAWRVYYEPYEVLRYKTESDPKFAGQGSTLSTHLSPAGWRFARYPYLRFAYKVPKGVPVGVFMFCYSRAAAPHEKSFCVASSPAFEMPKGYTEVKLATLIDDGEWHKIEIDVRKLQGAGACYKLRFWAGGLNGKPGSEYFLDDLEISAVPETAK